MSGAGTTTSRDRSLLRSSALMATGTVVSRITGIGRDFAVGAALGVGLIGDAFALGNTLPNMIYILVVGGALNAVFIPQLVRHMAADSDGGNGYADRLLTLVTTVLIALTAVAVLAAPWLVHAYTALGDDEQQFQLAVTFARYCLPQILFYGLYTMFTQVLNARGRFGLPTFAPILNNLVCIVVFGGFVLTVGVASVDGGELTGAQTAWLGVGSTVGVLLQALVLVPAMWRAGYRWRPRFDWRGHGLGKAGYLASWTVGLVLVNQLTYLVITNLATYANSLAAASGSTAAGIATYQRAHLIFVLPHSIVTVSVVAALLPRMSRAAHAGDLHLVGADVGGGMRLVSAAIVPMSLVGAVVAPDLVEAVFAVGATTPAEAHLIGVVVSAFLLGLVPFTLFYVLLRGWYAVEDTRTPFLVTVLYSVLSLVITVPAFVLAPDDLKVVTLALGYSAAYWVALFVAWRRLSRRLGGVQTAHTVRSLVRMSIASLLAGALAFGVLRLLHAALPVDGRWGLLLGVALAAAGGLGVYLAGAWAMRIAEVNDVLALVRGRLGR